MPIPLNPTENTVTTQVNPAPTPPTLPQPEVVSLTVNGIHLHFWLERKENNDTVLMVKKANDTRPLAKCERYAVCTITHDGNFYRNSGLPSGWGFALTSDRRIKEVR